MDNKDWTTHLNDGVKSLGLALPSGCESRLGWFANELLRWNARVNLTAITEPLEVLEKHLLDSLAALPFLGDAETLLDVGAGAGLPGIPLALACPGLRVTLADSVGKKVSFMKHALAHLGLAPSSRAVQLTCRGQPDVEGIERADVVIARALMDLGPWLKLAKPYVAPGGQIVAMLGRRFSEQDARAEALEAGLALRSWKAFQLPVTGAERALGTFELGG